MWSQEPQFLASYSPSPPHMLRHIGGTHFQVMEQRILFKPLDTVTSSPVCTYLVWMLEGDLEAQNSQHEELTLHDAVSELPEA
jgi:hypothetical protein